MRKFRSGRIWHHLLATTICFLCVFMAAVYNGNIAYALKPKNVPATEDLVQVSTIRNYFYSDPYHEMDIDVPNISDSRNSEASQNVNRAVDEFTANLAEEFYDDLEAVGDEGYGAIFVDYQVLMNTKNWFTLKLAVNSVAGSSNSYYKIYNIDRNTGKIIAFSDLFCTSDFGKRIKQDILRQMKQRSEENNMLVYFTDQDETLWKLSDKQNFYFDKDGQLVIPFDKYEVAPGYMGNPEFTIRKETLRCILKPEYQNITA